MKDYQKFYIDGQWVEPYGSRTRDVINPATEEAVARISMGEREDVDRAVAAARKSFTIYSRTTRGEHGFEAFLEVKALLGYNRA